MEEKQIKQHLRRSHIAYFVIFHLLSKHMHDYNRWLAHLLATLIVLTTLQMQRRQQWRQQKMPDGSWLLLVVELGSLHLQRVQATSVSSLLQQIKLPQSRLNSLTAHLFYDTFSTRNLLFKPRELSNWKYLLVTIGLVVVTVVVFTWQLVLIRFVFKCEIWFSLICYISFMLEL